MDVSTELIINRETTMQVFSGNTGQVLDVVRWERDGVEVLLIFVLKGTAELRGNGETASTIPEGYHFMCRVPKGINVSISMPPEHDFYAMAFQFSDAYLQKHCPEHCPNLCRLSVNEPIASFYPLGGPVPVKTATAQRELIVEIRDTQLPDHLRPVYRDIKIAELLVLQLEEILYGRKEDKTKESLRKNNRYMLRDYELGRVYRVRDILQNAPGSSYTLLGLAHEVGTNDATLKKHFKQVLGCTVFGYLTTCRMEKASALLSEDQKTVAEIAQSLGYKHVSHFSAAFRKFYGVSPTQFRRTLPVI